MQTMGKVVTMKTHEVKCWPEGYAAIADGSAPFSLRRNDRHYKVGDKIKFLEYDDRKGVFTGREVTRRITFMIEGVGPGGITPLHGLARGYAILGLAARAD